MTAIRDIAYTSAFLAILFRPRGCTCELWRHPNDPDGGLCAWCEDAEEREAVEAKAERADKLVEEEDLWETSAT